MKRLILFTMIAVMLSLGTALATDGNLPGGTSISVDITAPADDAVKVHPPGNVTLEGTASVGVGLPVPNTLLAYVIDVSFSTIRGDGGAGCGGDQNGDGISDTILDCEIASAKTLNDVAVTLGTVGQVGTAVFGGFEPFDGSDADGAAADVGPAGGDQLVTGPATDADAAGGRDVEQVLSSTFSVETPSTDGGVTLFTLRNVGSNATNFAAGLKAAVTVAEASDRPNKIIVFMSDGLANAGDHVSSVTVPSGVIIKAFAIGTVSSCTSDPNGLGSLADLAALGAAGSECVRVETVADLPDIVPGVVASELLSLELSVDGGLFVAIPNADITPDLPQTGPVAVSYSHVVAGLAPGIHELCVRATGSDGGGTGSVTECINVKVATIDLAPPTATNELGTPGQTHTVTATVAAGADGGVPGVTVNFELLSGPNAGAAGSDVTDANGQARFTYAATQGLAGLGTDATEACFGDEQGDEVCNQATKDWADTTPPELWCSENVNPHGNKIPPAGGTTLPGPKGGVNEDGFYLLEAEDAVDPDPDIWLVDTGSGAMFGPYPSGTTMKYTEDPTAVPIAKKMGSTNGQAGAIDVHIIGNGDPAILAVDYSGNVSSELGCVVPPPPK